MDDARQIQHSIDSLAKSGGGVVRLDGRQYHLSSPLMLPRTGPLPTTAVQIVGAGQYATSLVANPDFPPNRALIEWAPPTGNVWSCYGQRIANLTMWLPNGVDGVKAIWHQPAPDALASYANVQANWLQLDLENIRIECNNTNHSVLIDLGIGIRYSSWRNIVADPHPGNGVNQNYDTLLIRTPSTYTGYSGYVCDDGVGIGYSHLTGIYPMLMRGGACRTFEGRMYQSVLEDSQDGGGRMGSGAIAYHLLNSSNSTLKNIACEGKGSQFLKIENSAYIHAEKLAGGNCNSAQGQDSIALINSRSCRLTGHVAAEGEPAYSQTNRHVLTMDAGCWDCVADAFDVTVTGDGEGNALAGNEMRIEGTGCEVRGVAYRAFLNYRQAYEAGNTR